MMTGGCIDYEDKDGYYKKVFSKDEIIYFEDLIVFVDKIIVNAIDNLYYCDCKIVKCKAF